MPQPTSLPRSKPEKIFFTADSFKQSLDQQVIGQSYAKEEIVKQLATQVKKQRLLGMASRYLEHFSL